MIHIIDDLYIDADSSCYTVKKDSGRDDKNGERVYTPLAYPVSLENAMNWILKYRQRMIVENNDVSLKELFKLFKEENNKIRTILNEIKKIEEMGDI